MFLKLVYLCKEHPKTNWQAWVGEQDKTRWRQHVLSLLSSIHRYCFFFVLLLGPFLVAKQLTVSMRAIYTSYGKDTSRAMQFPFPTSCLLHGLRFHLHGPVGDESFCKVECRARPFQLNTLSGDFHPHPCWRTSTICAKQPGRHFVLQLI